jgi:GDP-L-fucose synthase
MMELAGRTAVIAGGAGFLGTNLALRLLSMGVKLRVTRHEKPLKTELPGAEVITADLRNPADCARAVAGMDYVFILSAQTAGAAVMRANPLSQVTPNVLINTLLLDAAYLAHAKRVLFISSGAAYPPTGDRAVAEDEMFDADPYDAYYSVAWMKRYAEILCRTYATKVANPMSTVIVRPSNVYGPHDKWDFATSHVTAALMRRVMERLSPLEVWGTGEDVRDLIYVDDFIDGLLAAFSTDLPHLAINICSGKGHSVRQILQTMLEVDGYTNADVRFDPSKPSTIPVRLMDNSAAKRLLGFEAKIGLAEGFRRTMQWYRSQPIPPGTAKSA